MGTSICFGFFLYRSLLRSQWVHFGWLSVTFTWISLSSLSLTNALTKSGLYHCILITQFCSGACLGNWVSHSIYFWRNTHEELNWLYRMALHEWERWIAIWWSQEVVRRRREAYRDGWLETPPWATVSGHAGAGYFYHIAGPGLALEMILSSSSHNFQRSL